MMYLVVTEYRDHYTVHSRSENIEGCRDSYSKNPWDRKVVKLIGNDPGLSYFTKKDVKSDVKLVEVDDLYELIHKEMGLDQMVCR